MFMMAICSDTHFQIADRHKHNYYGCDTLFSCQVYKYTIRQAPKQNFLLRSIQREINSLLDIPHSPLAGWSIATQYRVIPEDMIVDAEVSRSHQRINWWMQTAKALFSCFFLPIIIRYIDSPGQIGPRNDPVQVVQAPNKNTVVESLIFTFGLW